jgi:hypothetical protein
VSVVKQDDNNGHSLNVSTSAATNYTAPYQIAPNGSAQLATNALYNTATLAPTSVASPYQSVFDPVTDSQGTASYTRHGTKKGWICTRGNQYLADVRKEYDGADEKGRSRLLDEAQKRTGLHRKYLIRVLNQAPPAPPKKGKRKRRAEYGAAVVTALIEVWDIFEQPCGQRMEAVLKSEVGRLRTLGELRSSELVAEQLPQMSASTIDRVLRREKRVRRLGRHRNPNVQRLIYQKVPVKVAAEWDTNEIGNLQIDFVEHCGRSMGGQYIHTISAVDIATNWWEAAGDCGAGAAGHPGRAQPDATAVSLSHPGITSGQ